MTLDKRRKVIRTESQKLNEAKTCNGDDMKWIPDVSDAKLAREQQLPQAAANG